MDRGKKLLLLFSMAAFLTVIGLWVGPIAHPSAYHNFADQRPWLGMPHASNVWSNLPIALVGIWGLFLLLFHSRTQFRDDGERWPWVGVAVGLILTAIGSAYYHLEPNNARLVWDRLAMTMIFMSFCAALITERIDKRLGLWLWPVLLVVGFYSVVHWYESELSGVSDLRIYAGLQAFAILVTLFVLFLPFPYNHTDDLFLALLIFGLARFFEVFDHEVWDFTHGFISGHTLKHFASALAAFWLLRMVSVRKILE